MNSSFEIVPIGVVRSTRLSPEDDGWDSETSHIELLEPYGEKSLLGLQDFSHCVVIFVFDRAEWSETKMSRHPRGNLDWPEVGIFAQRAKDRPNRLGVTMCRVLSVDGGSLHLEGLDAIDGTPVVDIKPYMAEFDARGDVLQPTWSRELMTGYW